MLALRSSLSILCIDRSQSQNHLPNAAVVVMGQEVPTLTDVTLEVKGSVKDVTVTVGDGTSRITQVRLTTITNTIQVHETF